MALVAAPAALAQDVRQDWMDTADLSTPATLAGENPRAIGADLDGNVWTTGRIVTGPGNSSIAVWRHDSAGNLHPNYPVLWPPIGSGIQGEFAGVCLAVQTRSKDRGPEDPASPVPRIAVAGYGPAQTGTGLDYVVLHLEADGQFVWLPMQPSGSPSQPLTGVYNNAPYGLDDVPVAIAVSFYDDIYVTGNSRTTQSGSDIATIRIAKNSGGVIQHFAQYNNLIGQKDDVATDIAVKYSGENAWPLGDPGLGVTSPVPLPEDSTVFVVGSTITSTTRGIDYLVMAYPTGLSNPIDPGWPNWTRTYYHPVDPTDPLSPPSVAKGRDVATSVAATTTFNRGNRVWVTGFSMGVGTGYDYATLCYDMATGVDAWPAGPVGGVRYNNTAANGPDMAVKILAAAEFGYGDKFVYVTGKSLNAAGNYDFATIAYTSGLGGPGGVPAWTNPQFLPDGAARYVGPAGGDDEPMSMTLAGLEGLVVTGSSDNGFGIDMRTIKYERASGATPWLSTSIGFPQVPDGQSYAPMGMVAAPNPGNPGLPFIVVVGRVPGLMVTDPLRLGTVQYEQCPGNCPP